MLASQHLCLGGSFNPIHYGHLITAKTVADRCGYRGILLIPASLSPLKQGQASGASAEDRCQMCKLAATEDSRFRVDDIEILRGGTSFTIETIRELKLRGMSEVHWLIGADQLMDLPRWREPLALLSEAHLVIMRRPGSEIDWARLPAEYHRLQDHIVDAPLVDISATEIRRRVAAGESIDGLTPPAVVAYIQQHALYRAIA